MAYPDHGALLPTEALFTEPSAYTGVLKGEALKRASYLSSMDQFYAELEQASKQFEKQYSLAEKEFEFGVEEAGLEREFRGEEAMWERGFKEEALGQKMDIARMQQAGIGEVSQWQYDLGMEKLDFEREKMERGLTGEEKFEMASEFLGELYKDIERKPSVSREQADAPITFPAESEILTTRKAPKLDKFGYRIY